MVCCPSATKLLLALLANSRAQRPPPFSVPKTIPPDLQINGEWWFYSLLDSQFPHDVLTPLEASDVAVASRTHGTPRFQQLPQAEYVMLEFFAPWCPHCQHFAPEMVKFVNTVKGLSSPRGIPLLAVRTVDCEKLEMTALCNWGDANLMPRLVLGRREAFLAPLGPLAAQTAGIQQLFPVSDAQQAMNWVKQQVPDWPQNAPTPEPVDTNSPFFGWSQPVEGVVEPAQAPPQDIEVAVASLLHEAFSSLDFAADQKEALLDLLQLLCAVGPGGSTCRQSACQMQDSLSQQWDQLLQVITVTQDAQGQPMPPTTFHYLDWAAIERRHKWCNRPWPDFASESWAWCRGRTPGTRGYTCGLWMLFHGLLAGAALETPQRQLAKPPLEVVRGTIGAFFRCADCRRHFLGVPVSAEDLATPKAQSLWLWSVHNQATERITAEEQKHSASAPPREQWPSVAACPNCRAADGVTWDVDAVYEHLLSFYSPAFKVGEAPQQLGSLAHLMGKSEQLPPMPTVAPGVLVSVEVFYYTLCPHCELFLKYGLRPLIEAKLPGSQVQVTVLPVYPPLLQWEHDRNQCLAHPDCATALMPLCAMKGVPKPAPADLAALGKAGRFATCDISLTASGRGFTPGSSAPCSASAGFDMRELETCAEGPQSSSLLQGALKTLMSAMSLLHFKTGFQDPPSMPWVFLNGDLLLCDDGQTCTAVMKPTGDEPLPTPGSLLALVCSYLSPQPPGCLQEASLVQAARQEADSEAGGKAAAQAAVEKAKDCENCAEMGSFKWHPQTRALVPVLPLLLASAAGLLLLALALRRGSWTGMLSLGQREESSHVPLAMMSTDTE